MNRVRQLRKLHNLTMRQLAQEVNMSFSNLGYVERGEIMLREDTARILADYFGVSVDYLVGYTDDKTRNNQQINDYRIAFIDKIDDLTEDEIKDVEDFIKFIKSKRK